MSTAAPSGDISEGKSLDYAQVTKQFAALDSKLKDIMSIVKEVNVKLEQQDISRKRAALLAQKVALRRRASTVVKPEEASEEVAKRKEEEEAKRKKLEELKSRLQEVKTKVEEDRKMREASAAKPAVTGKGNVGAVAEETGPLAGTSAEFPGYWKEITGASDKFKSLGLLSG